MSAQRLKGQEVSILVVTNGVLEDTITDIQSFNMEVQLEIKSQGYLGEKTNRKDEVYNGVKFDMELHIHTQDWFTLMNNILDRAKRNTPDAVFNITGVFSFPNGQTPTFLIKDAHFGAIPHTISARGDYVKVKLDGEADDVSISFS